MDITIIILLSCLAAFIVGAAITFLLTRKTNKGIEEAAEIKAQSIIKESQAKGDLYLKDKTMEAKERFYQMKSEHEKHISEKDKVIVASENRIKQKETALNQTIEQNKRREGEIETIQQNLNQQLELIALRKEELDKAHQKQVQALEKIAGLSKDDAKTQLVEALKAEAKTEAMQFIKETMDEAKLTASKEAKKIVIQTIQRVATEHAIENAVTVFHIDSDEVKGRVIGREGRNIRALEAATGIEIIVDDTPEAIILSGFDPVRRELARLALHQLVSDGRIHPARIEEVVNKVKRQLEEEIVETGKRTAIDLGIHGLAPELIRMVGRMNCIASVFASAFKASTN